MAKRRRKPKPPRPREYSRTLLQPVRVEWHCPQCEDGTMVWTGSNALRHGVTEHFHRCHQCSFEDVHTDKHPRIEYDDAPLELCDF